MANTVYRKCPECGTTVENVDYCPNCGALVDMQERRRQNEAKERRAKQKEAEAKPKKPNALTASFRKAKLSDNRWVRYTARFFYSIWVVVIALGAILALVVGYFAA